MNRQARRQAKREVERLVRFDAFAKTLPEEKKKQIADEVIRRLRDVPRATIPCYRGGHNCKWPACAPDCDGRPGLA